MSKRESILIVLLMIFIVIFFLFYKCCYLEKPQMVTPIWEKDVSITAPPNEELIRFLQVNNGQLIRMSCFIDMTVAFEDSWEIISSFGEVVLDGEERDGMVSFSEDTSTRLPLDGVNSGYFLQLDLTNDRLLHESSGGTGVVQFLLNGTFRLSKIQLSGPITVFLLEEMLETAE